MKPSEADKIFDYYGQTEDEFLNQTRERSKKSTAQRSISSYTEFSHNTFFKESIIITEKLTKKPQKGVPLPVLDAIEKVDSTEIQKIIKKSTDNEKLKKIFDIESDKNPIEVEVRSKSHTDYPLPSIQKTISFESTSLQSIRELKKSHTSSLEDPSVVKQEIIKPLEEKFSSDYLFKSAEIDKYPIYFQRPSAEINEDLWSDKNINYQMTCFIIGINIMAIALDPPALIFYDLQTKIKRNLNKFLLITDPGTISITSIDITYDEEVIAIAFSTGLLLFYDVFTLKPLKAFNKFHNTPIIALKFYHVFGHSLKESRLITSDVIENVNKIHFEKGLLSYDADGFLLIKEWGVFTQIEILYKNLIFKDNKTRIAALASYKQVVIVSLEPKTYKIMSFYNPDINVIRNVSISWNEEVFNDNIDGNKPILSVLWGELVFLIGLEYKEEDKSIITYNIYAYYRLEKTADMIIFINNKEILILYEEITENQEKTEKNTEIIEKTLENVENEEKSLKISENEKKEENIEKEKKNVIFSKYFKNVKMAEIIKTIDFYPFKEEHLEVSVFLQNTFLLKTLAKLSFSLNSAYKNTLIIRSMNKNRVFLLKEHEKLLELGLFPYKEFLEKIIKNNDFIVFFKFIFNVYQCQEALLLDIPDSPEQRKIIVRDALISVYQSYIKFSPNDTNTLFFVVLETDNIELLFTEIYNFYVNEGIENIFLEALEPFIIMKKIKYMPSKSLRPIVTYYQKIEKLEIVQNLIFSLDYTRIDPCPLITLCLEFHFFKPLIYICTVYTDDFITPLIKIFSLYEQNTNKNDSSLGRKCLEFLKMSLNRKLITGGLIDINKYQLVLEQLIVWVFEIDNMRDLMEIEPKEFFEMIEEVFKEENISYLKNYKPENVKLPLKNDEISKDLEVIETLDPELKTANYLLLDILYGLEEITNDNKKTYKKWLALFIGKIVNYKKFYVSPLKVLESIKILLDYSDCLNYIEVDDRKYEEIYQDQEEILKSEFLIEMLRFCYGKVEENLIEEVVAMSEISLYCKVNAFVQLERKNYQKCFEIYVKSKNKTFQKEILDWLFDLMRKLDRKKDKNLQQINELILLNLPFLVQINTAQTHELISRYNKNAEKTVIKYLSAYPELQKKYLEKILNEREIGKIIDDELLLIHVELLCKGSDENELLENLKAWEYPLDGSLKLCRRYNKNEAIAYLLERTGASDEALSIYFQMITEAIDESIRFFSLTGKNQKLINHILDIILSLCKKHWVLDYRGQEWMRFLDFMEDLRMSKIMKMDEKEEFYTQIAEFHRNLFSNIFTEFARNVSLNMLLESITNKYQFLSMGYVKNAFLELFCNYSYEENIILNANRLVRDEIQGKTKEFLNQSKKGVLIALKCSKCLKDFKETDAVTLFFCGHYCHFDCFSNRKCPFCELKLTYQIERLVENKKNISPNKFLEPVYMKKKDELSIINEESAIIIVKSANNRKLKKKTGINMLRIYDKQRMEEVFSLQKLENRYNDF